jgi:hypothetical protein
MSEMNFCEICRKYKPIKELGVLEDFGADQIWITYYLCEKCLEEKQQAEEG